MTRRNGGGTTETGEVAPPAGRRERRTFTDEHKLRVLDEYDAADGPGARTALLRREGLSRTQVAGWRRARRNGSLTGPRLPAGRRDAKVERLRADNARLAEELARARRVIEVQGKVCALLETASGSAPGSSTARTSPRASRRPATPPSWP